MKRFWRCNPIWIESEYGKCDIQLVHSSALICNANLREVIFGIFSCTADNNNSYNSVCIFFLFCLFFDKKSAKKRRFSKQTNASKNVTQNDVFITEWKIFEISAFWNSVERSRKKNTSARVKQQPAEAHRCFTAITQYRTLSKYIWVVCRVK